MNKSQSALKKAKIVIALMLAVQIIYFFLPLNTYKQIDGSLANILSDILSGGEFYSMEFVFLLGAIGLGINLLIYIVSVFIKNGSKFRGITLPFFLASSIIFGFCWGMLIDKTGFVCALYSFSFVYLVSSIICSAFALNLDEKRVIKKEL